jgi:hypothetical protein
MVMRVEGAVQSPAILTDRQNSKIPIAGRYRVLAWIFVVSILATHAFFLWSVRDRIARGDPDFTVFYTAAKILRSGLGPHLYETATQQAVQRDFATNTEIRLGPLPYIHPPFEALIFLPFTFLSYSDAFVVWNALNAVILLGVASLLPGILDSLPPWPNWKFLLIELAFFPVLANFHQGQDAILLLLVVVLSFRALDRQADFLAGCWMAMGLFKYHLIIPLGLILAIWRGRKFVLGFGAMAAALVTISVTLTGWQGAMQYPRYAWSIVSDPAFGGIPSGQLPNLLGLIGGWQSGGKVPIILQVTVLALSAALLIAMASRTAMEPHLFKMCFACAVISALLVGYSTNSYDLSLLLVPLAVIADHVFRQGRIKWELVVPVIPLLISPFWFFLWLRWGRISLMAIFLVWWLYAAYRELKRPGAGQVT